MLLQFIIIIDNFFECFWYILIVFFLRWNFHLRVFITLFHSFSLIIFIIILCSLRLIFLHVLWLIFIHTLKLSHCFHWFIIFDNPRFNFLPNLRLLYLIILCSFSLSNLWLIRILRLFNLISRVSQNCLKCWAYGDCLLILTLIIIISYRLIRWWIYLFILRCFILVNFWLNRILKLFNLFYSVCQSCLRGWAYGNCLLILTLIIIYSYSLNTLIFAILTIFIQLGKLLTLFYLNLTFLFIGELLIISLNNFL